MRILALLAVFVVLAQIVVGATIVVGGCAEGDYSFRRLYDALEEAGNHDDANIVICGDRELKRDIRVDVKNLWISGGSITARGKKIQIVGDDVTIKDLNIEGARLQVSATGNVTLKNVHSSAKGHMYCIEVDAQNDVTLDNVAVSGCDYGAYVKKARDLNMWRVYVTGSTEALKIDGKNMGRIYVNQMKEFVVEKDVVYRIPPEAKQELERCGQRVIALQKKKKELEREIRDMVLKESSIRVQKVYPDVWVVAGIIALGLGAGYLLGRM